VFSPAVSDMLQNYHDAVGAPGSLLIQPGGEVAPASAAASAH